MTQTITVSDELHALLYRIKATYGSGMTPSRFLDYLIFGMEAEIRDKIIEEITEKAKADGYLESDFANKIEDRLA